jgi:hypothetical protein
MPVTAVSTTNAIVSKVRAGPVPAMALNSNSAAEMMMPSTKDLPRLWARRVTKVSVIVGISGLIPINNAGRMIAIPANESVTM